jgi:hypothetical protein
MNTNSSNNKKVFMIGGMMSALASLAGSGFQGLFNPLHALERLIHGRQRRKARQHPGSYRGCKKNKFAHMSRQRLRHIAKKAIMEEVRYKFQLPRRVLRAIVRTRVNREWMNFGKRTYSLREVTA